MLFGVHEGGDVTAKYPGVKIDRVFIGGIQDASVNLATKVLNAAKPSWDRGLTPIVSFKTPPATTAAGSYDVKIKDVARAVAGHPPLSIVWYHEPEDNMTGKAFSSAFHRVRGLLKDVDPRLSVGYAANSYQWRSGASKTATPADWRVEADFYGNDVYSGGWQPDTAILSEHAGFNRWYTQIVQTMNAEDRWGLTERGWKDPDDTRRAGTIRREMEWLKTSGCSFYVYWNTTGTENDPKLLNGPLATQALKDAAAYWASPLVTPPSPLPLTLEQRVTTLEEQVAELRRQVGS